MTEEPVTLQCTMLFVGGRRLFSCHDLSDHMLSLSCCQATTCFCVPSEIASYSMFKGPLHLKIRQQDCFFVVVVVVIIGVLNSHD